MTEDTQEIKVKEMVKNTDYEILKGISQFLTIRQIANYRKVSITSIYKGIYKLISKGLIRKIGRVYELTDSGINRLNSFIKSSNIIRLHNLAFKIQILNKPNNWDLQRSKIISLRTFSKEIDLNNNSYEIHSFNNLKIKTTNNSIIFYMPSFYGKNTDECFKSSLDCLFNSIPKIESIFKINLIKDRKANIEIISSHYAKLQDSLAKTYKTEGSKLYVKDEEENVWLIADFSFRESELETIYNKTAKEDMDTVKDFLNDLRKNPATLSQVVGLIRDVTANQIVFDKNMQSHIQAIQTLSKETKRLGKIMKGVLSENIQLKLSNKHQKTLGSWI